MLKEDLIENMLSETRIEIKISSLFYLLKSLDECLNLETYDYKSRYLNHFRYYIYDFFYFYCENTCNGVNCIRCHMYFELSNSQIKKEIDKIKEKGDNIYRDFNKIKDELFKLYEKFSSDDLDTSTIITIKRKEKEILFKLFISKEDSKREYDKAIFI